MEKHCQVMKIFELFCKNEDFRHRLSMFLYELTVKQLHL